MIERVFWKKQEIFKDYKKNKYTIMTYSTLLTFIPFGILYGVLYDKILRKIPFSLQLSLILITFQINKNLILHTRNFNQRVRENYLLNKTKLNSMHKNKI
jgi:hypothetical protein